MPSSASVSFSVKGWLASGIKVENLSVAKSRGLGEGVKPYKGVKYLTLSRDGVEVRCWSAWFKVAWKALWLGKNRSSGKKASCSHIMRNALWPQWKRVRRYHVSEPRSTIAYFENTFSLYYEEYLDNQLLSNYLFTVLANETKVALDPTHSFPPSQKQSSCYHRVFCQ